MSLTTSVPTSDSSIADARSDPPGTRPPRADRVRFVFLDALPRNGFFVDYDALDDRFGGGNYPGGRTRSASCAGTTRPLQRSTSCARSRRAATQT